MKAACLVNPQISLQFLHPDLTLPKLALLVSAYFHATGRYTLTNFAIENIAVCAMLYFL
jgi:hypothetical protein